MRVRILDSAHNDMLDGYWFYESQEPGVMIKRTVNGFKIIVK